MTSVTANSLQHCHSTGTFIKYIGPFHPFIFFISDWLIGRRDLVWPIVTIADFRENAPSCWMAINGMSQKLFDPHFFGIVPEDLPQPRRIAIPMMVYSFESVTINSCNC